MKRPFSIVNPKRIAKAAHALRFTRLPYRPYILNVEPGNVCNLKCPLCPTGQGDTDMARGFLKSGLFNHIFDQLLPGVRQVNLYSWGEPLLNPDLIGIIKYAKRKCPSAKVTTSSNLNVRDEGLLKEVACCGLDEIIVSCDGASPQTYAAYRVGGNFGLVVENMKRLAGYRKECGGSLRIIWNFIVFRHNEHEVETARGMAADIGVDFNVGLMRISMKDEILKPHGETVERDSSWIPDNPAYSAYDKTTCRPLRAFKTCHKPWREISVNWDGSVFPCCAVYGDRFSFGNCVQAPLAAVWNNARYAAARGEILCKKRTAATVCGICRDNGFMHL